MNGGATRVGDVDGGRGLEAVVVKSPPEGALRRAGGEQCAGIVSGNWFCGCFLYDENICRLIGIYFICKRKEEYAGGMSFPAHHDCEISLV